MAVIKIIELVGSSTTSSDDAVQAALKEARATLRNIKAVDVVSVDLCGDNLDEWRAHVRVAFLIERVSESGQGSEQPELCRRHRLDRLRRRLGLSILGLWLGQCLHDLGLFWRAERKQVGRAARSRSSASPASTACTGREPGETAVIA